MSPPPTDPPTAPAATQAAPEPVPDPPLAPPILKPAVVGKEVKEAFVQVKGYQPVRVKYVPITRKMRNEAMTAAAVAWHEKFKS